MKPSEFKAWRKGLGLKQKEAAELLGLKKRMIQYYERGHRDGRDVRIPLYISLACYAVSTGVADFDGETVTYDEAHQPQVNGAAASMDDASDDQPNS